MDLHRLRQPNAPLQDLVREHGRKAVIEELEEMCNKDMADLAFTYAVMLRDKALAHTAARVVACSGSYAMDAKQRAEIFLNNPTF